MEEYDRKDLISLFGDDFIEDNWDYFIEWLEDNPDFNDWDEDNDELAKDPYGFRGVSRND